MCGCVVDVGRCGNFNHLKRHPQEPSQTSGGPRGKRAQRGGCPNPEKGEGPKGWGPEGWGPEGWGREGGSFCVSHGWSCDQATVPARDLSQPGNSLTVPAEIKDSSKSLFSCTIFQFLLALSLCTPGYYLIFQGCRFSLIILFHQCVPHGFQIDHFLWSST